MEILQVTILLSAFLLLLPLVDNNIASDIGKDFSIGTVPVFCIPSDCLYGHRTAQWFSF